MRVAGRLASELLDYLTPHVKPGVTTREINDLAHDYMVNVQHTIPATLNYAPPGHSPYPASLVHVGQPRRVPRHSRRQEAEGRRHRQHRRHRDQGRLPRRHEPHVLGRQAVDPGEAPVRSHVRGDVARHPRGAAGRAPGRHRRHDPALRRRPRLLDRARVLRPRHRPPVPRGAAGAALRPAGHGPASCSRA